MCAPRSHKRSSRSWARLVTAVSFLPKSGSVTRRSQISMKAPDRSIAWLWRGRYWVILEKNCDKRIMKYHIHKAVVIGSGTMGAAIAAHLANAGVPVTLLDIVPKDAPADDTEARNKIVNEGWDRCLRAKPANLMSADL